MNRFHYPRRPFWFALAGLLAVTVFFRPPAHGASGGYNQTNVQSDVPGLAANTDPDLVNPWGLAFNGARTVLWVSDNGTGLSTLYNNGTKLALKVTIPIEFNPCRRRFFLACDRSF